MPAQAHSVKVFATADGAAISGYVYFPGGGRPKDAVVRVFGPNGERLAETKTNERGEFSFEARCKCDHRLIYETGDGHRAEWTIEAAELPDTLPLPGATTSERDTAATNQTAPQGSMSSGNLTGSADTSEVEEAVARAVRQEIAPLRAQVAKYREELERYQAKIRMQDIIGGIGYIMGATGLAFYFLGVRRASKRPGARSVE